VANVAFVSIYDRNAYGLRVMSAYLRRHGHECHIVFLKRYDTNPSYRLDLEVGEYPWQGINKQGRVFKYASNSRISDVELGLLKQVLEKIRPDVIGTTVNTPLRVQSIKVTRFLKEHFRVPIIWGGYDPTVNATDCLQLCDYTCVGEGDEAMLEIASRIDQGRSFDDVGNLAYTREGKTVFNPKYPAEPNLDKYPWRDNDPEFKSYIEDDRLDSNHPVLTDKPDGVYQAMSARGCPYKCTYCCEATFKDLYAGEVFLRRRSPEDLVGELAEAKKRFGIRQVHFEDEIFAMHMKWLERFAPLYSKEVGLPFTAYIYPTRSIEAILTLLKSAGLKYCCLALESGSERVNRQVFQRVYDRDLFLHTADVCRRLGLKFYTDVITYNPYEEEEDLKKTLDVLMHMTGDFDMCINKMFVLPGTKMAEQMEKDQKRIGDPALDPTFNYYSRLFWMSSFGPRARSIVRFVERTPFLRRHQWLVNPALVEWVTNPVAGLRSTAKNVLPARAIASLRAIRAGRTHGPAEANHPQPACR
jgi:radical SAM superfamily enzyme YgiQ (UPF0313 family)